MVFCEVKAKVYFCYSSTVMEFNAKKCKVLRVTRIRSIDGRNYYLGGIKLDRVDVGKDVGVLISHNLNWDNHVYLISSHALKKMLNVLYRTCKDINGIRTKKLHYIACVCSRLEYCYCLILNETSPIWNKVNAGLKYSFLEGIILSTSALVS